MNQAKKIFSRRAEKNADETMDNKGIRKKYPV